VECYVRAIAQGVRTASIIDDRVLHSLLLEILTDEGTDRKRAAKAEEIHESRWH
jgi:acetylglutamate kinase